ncbi:hypothetical protein TRFO_11571 [Tritrichomonas foetus]|uniref:Myb-like DNA-binding domain containing protein n=1 Tax=Tritrichomonas foetus TaxID=1144522 RepID=A0A1J4J7Y0_9EUKA|nr:hypothetical protein TRFO_11571 [Tritrichomonas foetus]|eukprot:OHS93771.1 hypothetical protein TRFO_11571 [Tritrichomonas foetus]
MLSEQQRKSRLAGPSSKKVKFTKPEDTKLLMLVQEYTTKDWKVIAEQMAPRTARQCRERWTNYVNPSLSKDPWTHEEDLLLIEKHSEYGNHWKLIEKYFPARSKNNIKHRWASLKEMVSHPLSGQIPPQLASKMSVKSPPLVISSPQLFAFQSKSLALNPANLNSVTIQLQQQQLQQQQKLILSQQQTIELQQKRLAATASSSSPQAIQLESSQNSPPKASATSSPNQPPPIPIIQSTQSKHQLVMPNLSPASYYLDSTSTATPSYCEDPVSILHVPDDDTVLEQQASDPFQYFDRILDQHELYANEIEKASEAWNFSEETYY